VEVLARRLPPGWTYRPVPIPPWWDDSASPEVPGVGPRATPPSPAKRGASAQPTLFEPPRHAKPTPVGATWVDALLSSPAFAAHRHNVRLPRPLPDDRLRGYLDPVAANGGTIALPALAASTGEPAGTLRMTLSVVQRLLNVDGAAVLTVRADDSVVCDLDLLTLQFDLDLSARH